MKESNKMYAPVRQYWGLLVKYLKPQLGQVVLLGLLLTGFIAAQLGNPQVVRQFIDAAQSGSPLQTLLGAAALFIGIAMIEQVLGVLVTYVSENVAWAATNNLREDLALHCLKLDLGFHKERTPGEMIERIDGDINDLADFFSQFAPLLLGNLLLLAGTLLLLWREDWRIGLVSAIISVIVLATVNRIRSISVPYWLQVRQTSAVLFGFLEERLAGKEDIRASGAIAYVMRRLYQLVRQMLEKEYKATRLQLLSSGMSFSLFGLAYIAAFVLGDYLFRTQGMTVGAIYLVFYYLGHLHSRVFFIVSQIESLQKAGASIRRVEEFVSRQSRIQDGHRDTLFTGPLEVQFDNVFFHYETNEETVLNDISFRLSPGRVLGMLGRTGSGKTTVSRLLFRFYDPTSGTIRLGSGSDEFIDIRQVRLAVLRRKIGMVTQEVQCFRATVRDNLTFFDETIPDDKILDVIQNLGLEAWLAALPEGLDTVLTVGSNGLSAGEAQLLAFARVFLQDPGLVILDEASSRLDPATEQLIDCALRRLFQNRTVIIIAHRLETVQRVDEIMILENGLIQEYGLRTQLASDPDSRFFRLLQTGLDSLEVTKRTIGM